MIVAIADKQDLWVPSRRGISRLARFFMRQLTRIDAQSQWREVSVVLLDDAQIREINRRYLHRADVTDVISFRYGAVPGSAGCYDAEIIVNVERAANVGQPRRGGADRELALYLAHGCHHLLGENDDTRRRRQRMRRRELRWLRQAADAGLLENLIQPSGGRPAARTSPEVRQGAGHD